MPVPVLLFAFANDREAFANDAAVDLAYLRDLPAERRAIRAALRAGVGNGRWETVVLPDATLDEIVAMFQDATYRDRIALFHYSGHAGSFGLLLEAANGQPQVVAAGGLAALLAQQPGLSLVFLNGCSTASQAQGLLDGGVGAVIATANAVFDDVATAFAGHFYRGLAGGAVVRRAFGEATSATQAALKAPSSAWRGESNVERDGTPVRQRDVIDAHGWPWRLSLADAAPEAGEWSLGRATGDPLWGLPSLPEDIARPPAEMTSPFRHLLPYKRDHASLFAGRGREIRALIERMTGADYPRITLLYGQSGVGKSSLLEAGVLPRVESTHTIRYVRREREATLVETLTRQLRGGRATPVGAACDDLTLADAWRGAESALARPVLLIVDQVEEIFADAKADELTQLAEALIPLFRNLKDLPSGKLVLSFRREWLAEVERALQGVRLPFGRVPIGRLDFAGIVEALTIPSRQPALRQRFGLEVQDDVARMIADDLLVDAESPVSPTLQIVEASLWDRATAVAPEAPVFDRATYLALQQEGLLLDDFLEKTLSRIEARVPGAYTSGLALDVLSHHCSALDTAASQIAAERAATYAHVAEQVNALVDEAKAAYLLVDPAIQSSALERQHGTPLLGATRLVHDTLAPLIRRRLAQSLRPGQRARRILEARVADWSDSELDSVLSANDLAAVEAGAAGMRAWTARETALVDASRRVQEEAQAALAGRQRTARLLRYAAVAAVVVLGAAGGFAWVQGARAKREAARAQTLAALQIARTTLQSGDPERSAAILAALPEDAASEGAMTIAREILANEFPRAVLVGHREPVNSAAFSPDGQWVVTASSDRTARIWNARTGQVRDSLVGHGARVTSAAFSPDGQWVVTASGDSTARIWNERTGQVRDSLVGHRDVVTSAAFSPDGQWVVTASGDGTARIWNARTGQVRDSLVGHQDWVASAAFSPDGQWVVTASSDGTARVWNARTGQVRDSLVGHRDWVTSAAFSPDGQWVVTASGDGTARIWLVSWSAFSAAFSPPGLCLTVDDWIKVMGADRGRASREYDACRRGLPRSTSP